MKNRWTTVKSANLTDQKSLEQVLGIHPKLCQLLVQRGVKTFEEAKAFFRPSLKDLHDPFLMMDMQEAVNRINKAISTNEKILIYGDYDVDGTTAVSLVYSFLTDHYQQIETYIPDRYKEGYGVSKAGIDYANQNDYSLIIALDCGIKALDKVEYAAEKGIDFIICDHHRPGAELPNAVAVLDPKRTDCNYPFDELSGCGVGFKLVQALCLDWGLSNDHWHNLLDLLAVSIGADIVPVVGENRVLAYFGLKQINETPREGFKLLKKLAQREDKVLTITDVVFLIGPRINAAGRIAHGKLAVELLTSKDKSALERISKEINLHNEDRKTLDKAITLDAISMVEETQEEKSSVVVYKADWHKGVIGIVASRLVEHFYKPTIVFTKSKDEILAGSARSVKGFDIYKALEACHEHLEQFGGHMYAAGMTLKEEHLEAFTAKLEAVVQESLPEKLKTPEIDIDLTLELSDFLGQGKGNFYKILEQFAPFGPVNLAPVFQTDGLNDNGFSKTVGEDNAHLRLCLRDPKSGLEINGIGFGLGSKIELLKQQEPLSILYHLEENEFRGQRSLQMKIKDVRLSQNV
jgi:single-stranded-DNA-specific exonuclease